MATQQFGGNDSLWVPDSLRCYRSFIAVQDRVDSDADLRSCSWHVENYDPTVRTYEARCAHRLSGVSDHYAKEHEKAAIEGDDRVPLPNCTCGFYAYYAQNMYTTYSHLRCSVPLHAVVSVSGRVLMGTRGVRAEKMTIEAVALNYTDAYKSKLRRDGERSPGRADCLTETERRDLAEFILKTDREFPWAYADEVYHKKYGSAWTEARALTILKSVSLVYGIPAYPTVEEMWFKFPKPDIAHLIPKES